MLQTAFNQISNEVPLLAKMPTRMRKGFEENGRWQEARRKAERADATQQSSVTNINITIRNASKPN
jgi:hypothetical protein